MRRIALAATTAGVATLAAGYVALGATGHDHARKPAAPRHWSPRPRVPRPPIFRRCRRARGHASCEPVAGAAATAPGGSVLTDPGLGGADQKPDPSRFRPPCAARTPPAAARTPVDTAIALGNGVALPPLEAPDAVKQIIEAGNGIARTPYKWGGGHGKWLDTGYDCSGSVSFALAAAGLLSGPLASGPLMSWGEPGKGKWVTIWANGGHVFLEVAGIRFDTSAQRVTGSRWINESRSTDGFVARHPAGL